MAIRVTIFRTKMMTLRNMFIMINSSIEIGTLNS